jgi:hypothetical protein
VENIGHMYRQKVIVTPADNGQRCGRRPCGAAVYKVRDIHPNSTKGVEVAYCDGCYSEMVLNNGAVEIVAVDEFA